jgi:hypothetical protein
MAYKGSIVKEDLSKLVDFMDDGSRKNRVKRKTNGKYYNQKELWVSYG